MNDLTELYQQVIIDHNHAPRNWGALSHPDREAEGFNPVCGDQLKLYLKINGSLIEDVKFDGKGCAISVASASLMTEAIKGKTVEEASTLFESVHALLTTGKCLSAIGKLEVLSGVNAFPTRVKCATLAWHTLQAAMQCQSAVATTE